HARVIADTAKGLLQSNELCVNAVTALEAANRVNPAERDLSMLFKGYAEALMPYAGAMDSWKQGSGMWTMAYGGNPERALRAAGHLAVNLKDSYDKDHEPTAATL